MSGSVEFESWPGDVVTVTQECDGLSETVVLGVLLIQALIGALLECELAGCDGVDVVIDAADGLDPVSVMARNGSVVIEAVDDGMGNRPAGYVHQVVIDRADIPAFIQHLIELEPTV